MTKAKMIETLQRMESEAWEKLLKYEFENMPPCTRIEEMKWIETNKGYKELINRWDTINRALEKCEVERVPNETALEYSTGTYRKNKEYREKLKAGA